MNKLPIDRYRNLIAGNDTEEVINELLAKTSKNPRFKKMRDEIIVISSRFQEASRSARLNNSPKPEIDIEINSINDSLLSIIDKLESIERQEENDASDSKSKYIIIFSACIVLLSLIYWQPWNSFFDHDTGPVNSPLEISLPAGLTFESALKILILTENEISKLTFSKNCDQEFKAAKISSGSLRAENYISLVKKIKNKITHPDYKDTSITVSFNQENGTLLISCD